MNKTDSNCLVYLCTYSPPPLRLFLQDIGDPSLTGWVYLHLNLSDGDDQDPAFTQPIYTLSLPEEVRHQYNQYNNAGSMLVHRLRSWPNIDPTMIFTNNIITRYDLLSP